MADHTLYLYGVVGMEAPEGFTARQVGEFLDRAKGDGAKNLTVRISSGGGYIDDGFAIYNLLREYPGKVVTRVDSVAASMGAIIALSGEERVLGDGAEFMIHNPWNVTIGDYQQHAKAGTRLQEQAGLYADIVAERAALDREQVVGWMDAETWFSGDSAVELGFATRKARTRDAMSAKAMASVRLDFLPTSYRPAAVLRAQDFGARGAEGAAAPPAAEVKKGVPMTDATSAAPKAADNPNTEKDDAMQATKAEAERLAAQAKEKETRAQAKAEEDAAKAKAEQERAQAAGAKAERERIAEIDRVFRSVGLADDPMRGKLISDGAAVADARASLIDLLAERQEKTQPETRAVHRAEVVSDERDKWMDGAQAWVLTRAPNAKAAVEKLENRKLDPGEFRGMSMLDLAKDSLARAGVNFRGWDKRKIMGTAFTAQGTMQTNSDFSVLLENTMNKTLQAAYATQPDSWRSFCAIGSVSDFRTHPRYRTGSFGTLDVVPESGEFKNKPIPDGEKSSISVKTVGNIVAISRKAMINDDLGVFNDVATMIGRGARRSIEVEVYSLLAQNSGLGPTMSDSNTLFHANHGNIDTTGAAPSVTSVDSARQLMASQLDISGNDYLDIRPSVWLGPLSLGSTVRVLNSAQFDPSVSNKFQVPNIVNGMFSVIVDSPRLSGTRWYAFADPNTIATLEVAFLDGAQEPFIDNNDGWRVDGTEWKVRLDFGVAAIDYRGALTNAGA